MGYIEEQFLYQTPLNRNPNFNWLISHDYLDRVYSHRNDSLGRIPLLAQSMRQKGCMGRTIQIISVSFTGGLKGAS
jgi:hypothetical protein